MLFPLIMFILPAMLMIVLGSVLLPSSKAKGAFIFTTQDFYFYQISPSVKVFVNNVETPPIHIKKIKTANPKQFSVAVDIGQFGSSEQENFMVKFFREHPTLDDAWFIQIMLPENTFKTVKMVFISPTKGSIITSKTLFLYYINFVLDKFKEDVTLTKEFTFSLNGHISPGIKFDVFINGSPVTLKTFNRKSGDFETNVFLLHSKKNILKFVCKLKSGLLYEIEKTIVYTGIDVNAKFTDASPTLKEITYINGLATIDTKLVIRKWVKPKWVVYQELDMVGTRNFNIPVPLDFGNNTYRLHVEKDGARSPYFQISIIRNLSE